MSTTQRTDHRGGSQLADQVFNALEADAPAGALAADAPTTRYSGPRDCLHDLMPQPGDAGYHADEDVANWGFAYGVAYTLCALQADPFESPQVIAQRAADPALKAWTRYSLPGDSVLR